jgi:hypothetical protein
MQQMEGKTLAKIARSLARTEVAVSDHLTNTAWGILRIRCLILPQQLIELAQ